MSRDAETQLAERVSEILDIVGILDAHFGRLNGYENIGKLFARVFLRLSDVERDAVLRAIEEETMGRDDPGRSPLLEIPRRQTH